MSRIVPSPATGPDLSGRLILYVGGRHQHVSHLRRIVESYNGAFVHHDGGVEQSLEKLESQLERADAVLFPVGCVSHAAQDRVKRQCRRLSKPFHPLRSTGVEAIVAALASVNSRAAAP